jgi:hypothetical protein
VRSRAIALSAMLFTVSCVGTTGGEVITFNAAASGPADAQAGQPYTFLSEEFGWNVTLTKAILHVGAIYFNRSLPVSGVQNTACILPDTYIGQVTTGRDVNLLSAEPQPFPALGEGFTEPPAIAAQVWLTATRIDDREDTTPILQVEGVAEKDGESRPFTGTITIGINRLPPTATDPNQVGASPICKERIVTPIPVFLELRKTGSLLLRVDPQFLFVHVDFSTLPPFGDGFGFRDVRDSSDQASRNLYANLHAAGALGLRRLYEFEWIP